MNNATHSKPEEANGLKSDEITVMGTLRLWNQFKTDKLNKKIEELNNLRRVGDAYAMLISEPTFISAKLRNVNKC